MNGQGNFGIRILAHSINPVGEEAITFESCHDRAIHADFLTHRWSRNSSSSRAIPFDRMVGWTEADPSLPLHYGRNRSGMQSGAEIEDPAGARSEIDMMFRYVVAGCVRLARRHKLHKELVNRYLEPWGWINTVWTMGRAQLMNAFTLRCTPQADPRAQRLFVNAARLYRDSVPTPLKEGEWHLPYITAEERSRYSDELFDRWYIDGEPIPQEPEGLLVWSVARCCWVSYRTVDGKVATWERAKERHDESIRDKHCTPLEHQLRARADHGKSGLVPGFDSYRSMVPLESSDTFDFGVLDTLYKDKDFAIP